MKKLKLIFLFCLVSLFISAQKDSVNRCYYAGANLSYASGGTDIAGCTFSLNAISKCYLLSAEFDNMKKTPFPNDIHYIHLTDKINGVNLLAGLCLNKKYFLTSFGSGISFVFGEKYLKDGDGVVGSPVKFNAVGLPFRLDIIGKPCKWIGIGTEARFNFNSGDSYNCLMLKVVIGKLR